MKIVYTAPFDLPYFDALIQQGCQIVAGPPESSALLATSEMEALLEKEQPDILIVEVNTVPAEALAAAASLRLLAVCRVGYDTVDVVAATQRGVAVINAPGRNAVAVAEFTLAMMINLARKFVNGARLVHQGNWDDLVSTWYGLEGIELAERTAGLIGLGAIGREVAKRLKACAMKVVAYDPFVTVQTAAEVGVDLIDLDTLLKEADFVSLHVPLNNETRGMIDARALALLKPTAYVINTARARLIDETALLDVLKNHRIAGAALDVHYQEPLPKDSPWLSLDNVLLTPHLGGDTRDVIRKHSRMISADILRFMTGQRPLNLVNPEVWERVKLL